MSYEIRVVEEPAYLHVFVTGDNSLETVRSYLEDVYRECVRLDASAVLIEEDLEGPGLPLGDIYQIVSEGSARTYPQVRRIAYVDVNVEHSMANLRFAETVASNRGMNMRLFTSVPDARAWLLEPTEPDRRGSGRFGAR